MQLAGQPSRATGTPTELETPPDELAELEGCMAGIDFKRAEAKYDEAEKLKAQPDSRMARRLLGIVEHWTRALENPSTPTVLREHYARCVKGIVREAENWEKLWAKSEEDAAPMVRLYVKLLSTYAHTDVAKLPEDDRAAFARAASERGTTVGEDDEKFLTFGVDRTIAEFAGMYPEAAATIDRDNLRLALKSWRSNRRTGATSKYLLAARSLKGTRLWLERQRRAHNDRKATKMLADYIMEIAKGMPHRPNRG